MGNNTLTKNKLSSPDMNNEAIEQSSHKKCWILPRFQMRIFHVIPAMPFIQLYNDLCVKTNCTSKTS
jgi:hypothetical protein